MPRPNLPRESAPWGRWVTRQERATQRVFRRTTGNSQAISRGQDVATIHASSAAAAAQGEIADAIGVIDEILDPPTAPVLASWQGLLLVSWDGNLLSVDEEGGEVGYAAPARVASVDIMASTDAGTTYARVGILTTGSRTQAVAGLGVNVPVLVRLVAVDGFDQSSAPSSTAGVTISAISGSDIAEGSVGPTQIRPGAVEAAHVAPDFGSRIDIAGNTSTTSAREALDELGVQLEGVAGDLTDMQVVFQVTPTEARISRPDSAFDIGISNTRLEFRESGVVRAFLSAGVFNTPRLVTGQVVFGSNVIEDSPDGLVFRRL